MFAWSPSNLSQFIACPRKFQAQSITHELKWVPTAQRSRGTIMHSVMEDALRKGWQDNHDLIQDDKVDTSYVRQVVDKVQDLRRAGYQLGIEREVSVTKQGEVSGWWDANTFMRCKADVILLHPDPQQPVIIGDIKTGRNWGDTLQCRMECLIAHMAFKRPIVRYEYWYIDQGETEGDTLYLQDDLSGVQDIFEALRDGQLAIKNNDFPPTVNKFCKWCGLYQTPECGL